VPGHSTLLAITVFTPALAGWFAVAFMAPAPKGNCAGPVGIGVHNRVCRDDAIIVLRGTIPNFCVGKALLSAAYGILWSGARKFEAKNVSILLALVGVLVWIVACSIGAIYARPEARATVMAAIGIGYTLLVVFELWRGRGDEVWRWPIMVLLVAHAVAIPIHIPLAGAWTHPDPSDPSDLDLLTFAVFEGAFVCICVAYLFGGLAKDRIAARYRRASLTDPLTGAANRRGFFERGERLLMRSRFARERTALILFDLDRCGLTVTRASGPHVGSQKKSLEAAKLAASLFCNKAKAINSCSRNICSCRKLTWPLAA
jgi:hypothetical protein